MKHETKDNKKYLIVGLGNPGKEFENTPHNIGWHVILGLAAEFGADFEPSSKMYGDFAKARIADQEVIMLKPTTYMNRSGLAVRNAIGFWKISINNLLVIQDDSDMELGRLKLVFNQSSAGHKGLDSIIRSMGNQKFARLKIGVRPKNLPQGGKKHVKAERFILRPLSEKIQNDISKLGKEVVENWIKNGLSDTINKYNGRT